jgi:hypothetical protein
VKKVHRKHYHDAKFWVWAARALLAVCLTLVLSGAKDPEVRSYTPIVGALVVAAWLAAWHHMRCEEDCTEREPCGSDHKLR